MRGLRWIALAQTRKELYERNSQKQSRNGKFFGKKNKGLEQRRSFLDSKMRLWVSSAKQRLKENIQQHVNSHKLKDGVPAVLVGEVSDFYLYYPKFPGRRKKTQEKRSSK